VSHLALSEGRKRTKKEGDEKMGRKVWFLFALISVSMVIAIQPIMLIAYQEFYVKPALSWYKAHGLEPWVDAKLFCDTWYAEVPFYVYAFIGSLWIGVALLKLIRIGKGEKRKSEVCRRLAPIEGQKEMARRLKAVQKENMKRRG